MTCFLFSNVYSGHLVDHGLEGRKWKLGKQQEAFCVLSRRMMLAAWTRMVGVEETGEHVSGAENIGSR